MRHGDEGQRQTSVEARVTMFFKRRRDPVQAATVLNGQLSQRTAALSS